MWYSRTVHRWILACVIALPAAVAAEPVQGLTLEAGIGGGAVYRGGSLDRFDSVTFGGSVAAGTWLRPNLALTGRLTMQHYQWVSGDDSSDYRYWFVGPSLQYWPRDWLFVAGGAGPSVYARKTESSDYQSWFGLGLDARVGIAVPVIAGAPHRVAAWLEAQPSVYYYDPGFNPSASFDVYAAFTLNVGYQLR